MGEKAAELASKVLDLILKHEWTLVPCVYILFFASLGMLAFGKLTPAYWGSALLICLFFGCWALFLPIRELTQRAKINARLRVVSDEEERTIKSLIESRPITITWPHDSSVSGLLRDGILEKRPCSIGNGMECYALSQRGRRQVLKAYRSIFSKT